MTIVVVSGCHKNPPTPPPPAPVPATVKINSSNGLTMIGATVNFTVTPNDDAISQSGLTYSTSDDSTGATKVAANQKIGIITQALNGLSTNTKYNIWAYAKTAKGTIYSHKIKIWTYALVDYDGNGYHAVTIAGKTFTVENLKVTHYRNGDPIPNVTDNMAWHNDKAGAMCWYDNNRAKYDSTYGALYNEYAVIDHRGLAPKGWHVSTYYEWNEVNDTLGGSPYMGGNFKETGTSHWKAPNTGATNSTGFTALPAGDRGDNLQGKLGAFDDLTMDAAFWTPTPFLGASAMVAYFEYNNDFIWISNGFPNNDGFSVRLIKNQRAKGLSKKASVLINRCLFSYIRKTN